MKNILPRSLAILFAIIVFGSCCIHHKTFAQSDRIDTHRPKFPVIECVPCGNLQNTNENFITTEAFGPSGSFAAGFEMGHNFANLRIYGAAGISYWPFRPPNVTLTGQFGIVGFNPNFPIHPEIGIGYSEWAISKNYDGSVPLHPSIKNVLVGKGNYQMWHAYAGLSIKVPYSNIDLSLRIYKMETLKPQGHDSWYPGIVCGFRL
jgi:hypothetical protein